nr:DEAD/DEAH box helicase [Desulforamulus aquiferis]
MPKGVLGGTMQFAEVAVSVPVRGNQSFHYRVPEALAEEIIRFSRVEVPFSGRLVQGFVLAFNNPPDLKKIKEIKRVVEQQPFLDDQLLVLAQWMEQRYLCGLGDALQSIAGSAIGKATGTKEQDVIIATPPDNAIEGLARAPKQRKVLEVALSRPEHTKTELAKLAGVNLQVVNSLIKKGYLSVKATEPRVELTPSLPVLTKEQEHALAKIRDAMGKQKPQAILLHGVTGSGKTEVYLRSIADTMSKGRQSIILIPEISLTPQMVARFKDRFGNLVAVLHSSMSNGERYAEKKRIRDGLAQVILGARSAIFAPTERLG